jgi:hypothetical protein
MVYFREALASENPTILKTRQILLVPVWIRNGPTSLDRLNIKENSVQIPTLFQIKI